MLCPACHTEAPVESTFCPKCGKPLAAAAGSPSAAAQPTAVETMKAKMETTRNAPEDPEHDLWKGGFSPKAMLGYWLLAGVVTIVAIVVGIVSVNPVVWIIGIAVAFSLWVAFALYLLYQRLGVEYHLTTQRLFHRQGILARVTNRIEVIDIDDVQFSQSLVERFLGVGTIRILSTDLSDPKLIMTGIDDVKNVADIIDKVRRDERRRRGLHIETV
ncbi:MAG: PH domain-containing protein [Pirellulaceae bacterium]